MTVTVVSSDASTPTSEQSGEGRELVSQEDNLSLIAVMGVTGSGKSNFLRLMTDSASNRAGPVVGHDLDSCTQKTEKYECVLGGHQFVFFDTPGFDDTYRGDADILSDVAQVLSSSYKNQLKLKGIIYLHRIKDERMTNALMRNLTMFRSLCGDDAFQNVVLVTTFWDELQDLSKGEAREKQLTERPEWWGYMIKKGSTTRRFDNTRESALSIVADLVGLPTTTLQVQEEMVNQGLKVEQTTAGEALGQELLEQQAKFEKEIQTLREQQEQAKRDHDVMLQEVLQAVEAEKTTLLREIELEQAALHADRREEQRLLEQEFADERVRWQKRLRDVVQESNRAREDSEADARDERRRLKLEFEGQLQDFQRQLATRDQDSTRRLEDALSKSNMALLDLKSSMGRARDRRQYEDKIREVERQQREVLNFGRQWVKDMEALSRKIQDNQLKQKETGGKQWEELEARIQELESTKKSKTDTFWSSIGSLAGVGSLLLALI